MNALRIDFGPRARRRQRPWAWLLLAVAAASSVWLLLPLPPLWRQQQQLQAAHQDAVAQRAAVQAAVQDAAVPAAQREALAQAAARLHAPWPQLLAGIESAVDAQVVLLGLEPDAQARVVRIQAQARDMPALLAYLGRLAQVPGLAGVRLESHQILAQHPQRPVDGSIVARWQAAP
ncbi:hypothetical protein LJR039_006030 [Pseudorhodoferax sp. LjRoot39]|uniref:hypothetical protein n=1 Tax=Pseudorhodoferax sp. LjRoot39 TaxID=3342328 RepID=UPI003ED07FCD